MVKKRLTFRSSMGMVKLPVKMEVEFWRVVRCRWFVGARDWGWTFHFFKHARIGVSGAGLSALESTLAYMFMCTFGVILG